MIKRSDKKAFWGNVGSIAYERMTCFTELSFSQNPKEYSRQYVDEPFERTDVIGYSPSISYQFDDFTTVDEYKPAEDIALITIMNIVGEEAHRDIVQVDFSRPQGKGKYMAVKRTVAVIPDSEGSGTDAYTYSGTFKTVGPTAYGLATLISSSEEGVEPNPENVQAISFEAIDIYNGLTE